VSRKAQRAAVKEHVRIADPTIDECMAIMSRAVFQAGLSWAAIDHQWAALCEAYDGFAVRTIARYGDADVERLGRQPGIIHSERKTRATIANARSMLAVAGEFGGLRAYLRSQRSYDALVQDIRRRFAYVGDISAYYFLYRAGERVPPFGRWIKTVEGDHPRIRAMVSATSAKSMSGTRRLKRRSAGNDSRRRSKEK